MHTFIGKIGTITLQDVLELNTKCNVIHVPSNYIKSLIQQKSIVNKHNIIVIPPGISVKKYFTIPRRPSNDLFIMIGRLEQRKHYDHAIAAFKIVTKYKPERKLLIIGDGPLKYKLTQLIKKYGLERNVVLLGSIDEETKLTLLSKADALIHLGYPEGFGIVIVEALASGVPVITYNVPPVNELILHEITGLLVEKNNIFQLARTIMNFNKYNFDKKTLRDTVKRYDINIVAEKFRTLYTKLYEMHR